MRIIFPLFLMVAFCLRADDRADVDRLITALSEAKSEAAVRGFFAADADTTDLARFVSMHTDAVESAGRIWSEKMPPRLVIGSVHFVSHATAVVDATDRQVGTVYARSAPLVLILVRGTDGWKVAGLRLLSR